MNKMKEKLLKLAQKHGTPLFIIDHNKIRANYRVFKKNLPRVQAYYAVKANSDQEIIKTLFDEGASSMSPRITSLCRSMSTSSISRKTSRISSSGQDHLLEHDKGQGNSQKDKKIQAACYL